jgi:intracellular sulfur oxidation DsrE/DsrF family protein
MFDVTRFTTHRRGFLGKLAAGAAAFGLGGLVAPLAADRRPTVAGRRASADPQFEAWLNKITGTHKMVFDVPEPNGGFGLAWSRVFLNTTNETYGTTDAENSVVVVLRHGGIPLGMESGMWAKYKFGEFFKITDGATHAPAVRNPFARVKPGELPLPGMALDELVGKGVLFGICNVALAVYGGIFAKAMGLQADAVKQEWVANLLPGVQVVPSGVIAVNGSQERGCAYCFAG